VLKNIIANFFKDILKIDSDNYSILNFNDFRDDKRLDNTNKLRQTIFVEFTHTNDTNIVTQHFVNLHNNNSYSIVDYVTKDALPRYRAVEAYAKALHKAEGVNTKIRTGKYDFKLLTREKGSNTKWSDIDPVILPLNLPDFNVGKVYPELIEEEIKLKEARHKDVTDKNRRKQNVYETQDTENEESDNDDDDDDTSTRMDEGETNNFQSNSQDDLQDNEHI
jgi:hypothetical protein